MSLGRRHELAALASYSLVALITTWPLIQHLTTAFPGSGTDVYGFIWNNWWIHHAVVDQHRLPYFTDAIFAPFTADLRLHTLGLLYGLISIPFTSALTPVGVLNIQILLTIVLNGFAAFRLASYVTKHQTAGFISGLLIAAAPAITFHLGVGRPSCAGVWPAIFAIKALLQLLDRPDRRSAFQLALWLVATLMVDQQVALFCAFWLVVVLVSRARSAMTAGALKALFVAAALVAIPAFVLYSSLWSGPPGYTTPSPIEATRYSYPLRLLWTPAMVWSVYGLVLTLGLLGAIGLVLRRSRASVRDDAARAEARALHLFLAGTLIALVFSFGPVAMGTDIQLPFAWVQGLPGLDQFRTPYRFQIPAAIGLAVLAAIVITERLNRPGYKRSRLLVASIVLLTIADLVANRYVEGFKLEPTPVHAIYEEIARDPRDLVILEVPFGVRTGTDRIGPGETLTIFQPVHKKRLMNGFLARAPLAALEYYRASPAIMFLAQQTPMLAEVPADLADKVRTLKVGYVVIHPELIHPARLKDTVALIEGLEGVQRLETDERVIAFRVR